MVPFSWAVANKKLRKENNMKIFFIFLILNKNSLKVTMSQSQSFYLCEIENQPMIKTAFQRYINNFKGFSREIWILTLITFINRAGTMVLPFLSKYLKEDLQFSYSEVGWIMVSFGVGSMLGSWLGGKLSDKIGFYKIMIFSLFTSGLMLALLGFASPCL
jgi:predicted MFS family arabinose efflux permease